MTAKDKLRETTEVFTSNSKCLDQDFTGLSTDSEQVGTSKLHQLAR